MKLAMAALAGALACGAAQSAELSVLSGGAIEPGLHAAVAAFEKDSGHHVRITFNTTPQILKRVGEGSDRFDVVIAPPAAIDALAKDGKVAGERVNVGKVGLGVAIRPGAPVPDIATVEAVQRAVLEADSLTYNRASTGIYFENLLKKWGIADQVQAKTTRYADGASVMEHALKGQGREIAFGAITEIKLYAGKGLRYIGPLPAAVQNHTSYLATPMAGGTQAELAQGFVRFLGSPMAKQRFVDAGIE